MTIGNYEALFRGTSNLTVLSPAESVELWIRRYSTPCGSSVTPSPLSLNARKAASYLSVGLSRFREMVREGQMPKPKLVGKKKLWDRRDLEAAFSALGQSEDSHENSWDEVLAV
jgi:excisionase family DNA binding protein